ncbi:MAG: RNA polymerase sigma factor [Bacteroidales bacterium]|nr:RNA polymerase sigma factor [Bacteroidales bacterium]
MFKRYSDKSIIRGIKDQDDKILNWLYDNYYQPVKSYVTKNSGTADDVSDVFQDSIIVLYRQICEDKLELTTDLKGYFYSIARNTWNNSLRKKKKTLELHPEMPDDSPSEEAADMVFERIVSRAFEKLSHDHKKVLTLFSEGLSYETIAVKLKLKNETYARRKKYLAKEALLEMMKEDPEYHDLFNFRR